LNARDWAGMPNYPNLFQIRRAKNVTIRGRGILDMHLLPWHARKPFDVVNSSDIRFEGIIILDSPDWDINLLDCENVEVDNVKEICAREESDGIDVCDCDHVTIRGCFLRNNDDEICLKTLIPGDSEVTKNVDVSDCVIWNDRARALCIGGGETRADIHDVTFHDCDVIHDLGNWSTLAVLVCDSGRVSNIRFERIRVEDTPHKLMWCLIPVDAAVNHRGQIDGITFQDISAPGAPPSELGGFDAEHLVANVDFENIQLGGHPMASLSDGHFAVNQFVTGTEIDGAPAR